jgi:hypothetical protein
MPPLAMKLTFHNSEFWDTDLESEPRQLGAPIYLGVLDLGGAERSELIFLLLFII